MGIEWDMMHQQYLVGGLEHFLFFHSVGNVIIPTDELIFFRWVGIPPASDGELTSHGNILAI